MRFNFDFISFLIGFISASIIAAVIYRFRKQLGAMRQTTESGAGTTRRFITNTAEGRYLSDLVKSAHSLHAAGDAVKLSEIYVEPRFIRPPEPADPNGEHIHSVFHVVPILHDIPQIYAPYNVDSLTVNDLKIGDRHLALLGLPGTGKSTALAIMALIAAGNIHIAEIDMMADEVFEDEIRNLPKDEQDKAKRQREDIQARAMAQLEQAQKKEAEEGKITRAAVDFTKMLPILVHMRDVDLRPEAYGDSKAARPLDPAEPLVKALQRRTNVVTASSLPRLIYNRLNAGACMVLIDGFDNLNVQQRTEKLVWLQQFIQMYENNFIIVTGPLEGYDPLVNMGLTPIFMRSWSDSDYGQLVERWSAAWPAIAGKGRRRAAAPDEQTIRRVLINNRGRGPLDVTLKIWAAFANDEKQPGRRGWYDYYIRQQLPSDALRPVIQRVAAGVLDAGNTPLAKDKLKEVVTAALTGADGKVAGNVDEMINKVTHTDLMIDLPDGSYGFKYSPILGFLAGETLESATPDTFKAVASNPAWNVALPFAAAHTNLDPVALQWFNQQPDILYSNLFSMTPWLIDSQSSAGWRAEVFKRLTAILAMPAQFPTIREHAVAAMVASRDKGVIFVLRNLVKSPDSNLRRLACIGFGAIGDGEAIKDLAPMLTDKDADVQLAAGLALGSIGTEAALETMLNGFVEGEQALRQAVAEALAAIPGEGHAVLRDAVTSKDMMVRHAAVFGLARIKAAWALALLYRTLLEDDQWYVRNAAEQAFREAEGLEGSGAIHHPEADALTWLVQWAATKGEGVPAGPSSRQVLIRALQEGDPLNRIAAAQTLGNLGHVPALKPLYSALKDQDDKVRAAAYESLTDLQIRLGAHLPAVN